MADCEKLTTCAFFKEYNDKRSLNMILDKFIADYCQGAKQGECVRKKISKIYGIEKVPLNMTPSGVPVLGTTRDNWSKEALNPSL